LAWAMSNLDEVTSGTKYQANVRLALQFLRDLQYAHTVAHGSSLISNLVYEGTIDTIALAADCAECLLAMTAAMDAYGESLTTSGGYSVKTMANDLYYSLCVVAWQGSSAHITRLAIQWANKPRFLSLTRKKSVIPPLCVPGRIMFLLTAGT
jgi:hypothetical protein